MQLSEEQKGSFIRQLQLTKVKSGQYLIFPNAQNPAFLVPIENKKIFRNALALLKPLSGKGELKKRILSYIPPKWLVKKFPSIHIENPEQGEHHTVILPWSQKINDKITYISFDEDMIEILVNKFAFTHETKQMVKNEHSFLTKLANSEIKGVTLPRIKGFGDHEKVTFLQQEFYDGIHLKNLSPSISAFFTSLNNNEILPLADHPYLLNRLPEIREYLNNCGANQLWNELELLVQQYAHEKFRVATMHADFSHTNTVITPDNQTIIIDWEDACDDGICIDTTYFKFRTNMLEKKSWIIQNAEQFLAVFHYTYFMVKKQNTEMLNRFQLKKGEFNLMT